MHVSVVDSLEKIPASGWNALAGESNPFLRHEFLSALESTGCVCAKTGWQPQHLIVHRDASSTSDLVGALPLYLKNHSYGEYVFDWACANTYEQAGLRYYPKLVAGIPFTPVTGSRLLSIAGAESATIKKQLVDSALELMRERHASPPHSPFLSPA